MPVRVLIAIIAMSAIASASPCPTRTQLQGVRTHEEIASAKSLFTKGVAFAKAGKEDEACQMFESSMRLDPQIGTRLNVAECRMQKGDLVNAHALFLETADDAVRANDRRLAFITSRVAALEGQMVRISLQVAEPQLAGLTLSVAGCTVAVSDIAQARFALPGTIAVDASAPNRKPLHIEKTGVAAEQLTIEVPVLAPFEDVDAQRRAKEAEAVAATERRKAEKLTAEAKVARAYDRHPARKWMLVTGGIGAAAVITGVVFGVAARGKQADFNDAGCGERDQLLDEPEYARCEQLRDGGQRDALLGNVLMASGGAVLAASLIVFIIDPGNVERPSRTQVGITHNRIDLVVRW